MTTRPASVINGSACRARCSSDGAREREPRRIRRCFDRRECRRHERHADPGDEAFDDRKRPDTDTRHADAEIEIIDRARHQLQQLFAEHDAEDDAEPGCQRAQHAGLHEYHREQLPARQAQRPQHADEIAPLQHREIHTVKDQKQPDEQRQQAHGRQVGHERPAHLCGRARAAGCGEQLRAVGQGGLECGEGHVVTVRDAHVDAAQPADLAQPFLRRCDVANEQAIEAAAVIIGKDREQCRRMCAPAHDHRERVAFGKTQVFGRPRRGRDHTGCDEEAGEQGLVIGYFGVVRRCHAREAADFLLGEEVDAEQRVRRAVDRDRALEHGSDRAHSMLDPEAGVDILAYAARPADDLMRCLSRNCIHRQQKGVAGTRVRKINCNNHGHTDGDAEH